VHIPGYHDGVAVGYVDCRVFRNDKMLERVYTSDQMLELDYGAGEMEGARENFQGCANLKEIHFGKNVSRVGFQNNISTLERITLDERNKTYHLRDGVLFEGKGKLICYPAGRKDEEYVIPQNVHYVEMCAFSGAKHLKKVQFPKGIKNITGAFKNSGLMEVVVPSSIERYSGAFADCGALERAVIETKADAYQAFYGCGKLKSVGISSVPSGDNFGRCGSLERFALTPDVKDVVVRDDVLYSRDGKRLLLYPAGKRTGEYALAAGTKKIAPSAFCGAQYLKHARMNQELAEIGESAFQGAEISQVTLNQGLEEIGGSAFSDSHLSNIIIPDSVYEIGVGCFSDCKKLKSVHLPEGIKMLEGSLFWNCTGLTELRIPASVRWIEAEYSSLVSGCRNLTRITVGRKSKHFISIGGVLYSKSKKTLYAYPAAKRGAKYAIPKSVREIKSQAFMGSRHLKRIVMKDGVVRIGLGAFGNMQSLRNITLSKKLKEIENRTFAGCRKLESLAIPNQVTEVGNEAFEDCAGLKRVTVGRRVRRIYRYAFADCVSMRKMTFRNKSIALGDKGWWNIDRNIVFENTGSRNYRKLTVRLPSCNQRQKKKIKVKLYRYGLDKKAKVLFGRQ